MASAFDKASLVMLPNAYKDQKLYSVKPTDRSGDFAFSRDGAGASPATRVGPTGLIEKGRENLVLYSNKFDEAYWSKLGGCTIVGQTATDPFGVLNNAWVISFNGTTNGRLERTISTSGIKTMSIYLRTQSGTQDVQIGFGSAELVTKTITTTWQRIEKFTPTGNLYPRLRCDDAVTLEIFAFQVEVGLAATDYIETTTAPVSAGLLGDMPRLDYSGGAECPSLLLEPSRTNAWIYSEYLDYPFSNLSNVTTTQNTTETLSPEGLYNAAKLEGAGFWLFRDSISGSETGTWTISCYVKAVNASSNNTFRLSVGGNNFSSNLTATSEWQRFDFTTTNGGGTSAGILRDSSTNDADLYIYGFQVEEGSYPTSYIPTYGSSQTRARDRTDRGANLSYTGDYTLFMEFKLTQDTVYLLNSNNSTAYSLFIENDDCYFFFGRTGGDSGFVQFVNKFDWAANLGTNIKMAFYKNGTSSKMFVNGTEYTPSSNTLSTGNEVLDWRYLNYSTTADRQEQAYIKQLLEFEEALSDTECINLTTL